MTQVTGILTDEVGTVLANTTCAVVAIDQVVGQDGGGRVSRGSIVVTDGAGEFDADIKPGRYELVVEVSAPADANVKFRRIGRLTVLTTGPMTLEEALDKTVGEITPNILQQAIAAKDDAEAAAVLAQSAYQGRQYATRAEFVEDEDYAPANGTVATAGGLSYVRSAGATALPGLPGWLPFGTPSARHYGAVGDNITNDAAPVQAWVDDYKGVLHFDRMYRVNDKILVETEGRIEITTGAGRCGLSTQTDEIACLEIAVNSASISSPFIGPITIQGLISTNPASIGLLFTGNNTTFVDHGRFCPHVINFCDAIVDEKTPRTTSFGLEAMINFSTWADMHLVGFSRYGFHGKSGSGTGNSFTGYRPRMRANGAAIAYSGDGNVVGDLLISDFHPVRIGGEGGVGLLLNDDLAYLASIQISNYQMDARMTRLVQNNSGRALRKFDASSSRHGGTSQGLLGAGVVTGGVILGENTALQSLGKRILESAVGANTVTVGSIRFNSDAAVKIKAWCAGRIGGSGRRTWEAEYSVCWNINGVEIIPIRNNRSHSAAVLGFEVVPVGDVPESIISVNVTFEAFSTTSTRLMSQVIVEGNNVILEKV